MNSVRVLGAATSADTHHAGQERAPDALLTGGFVDRLAAAAREGTGLGNVVHETFRADRTGDPAGCAEGARRAVEAASRLVVHFDVDAVDSGDLPLANFPHCGTGVPLAATGQVLEVLFAAPRLSAVVLTEVNPSYDPDGDSLDRYIDAVTGALITGLAG